MALRRQTYLIPAGPRIGILKEPPRASRYERLSQAQVSADPKKDVVWWAIYKGTPIEDGMMYSVAIENGSPYRLFNYYKKSYICPAIRFNRTHLERNKNENIDEPSMLAVPLHKDRVAHMFFIRRVIPWR